MEKAENVDVVVFLTFKFNSLGVTHCHSWRDTRSRFIDYFNNYCSYRRKSDFENDYYSIF